MDFSLSDEQRLLIDTVRKFIAEQLAPLEDEVERIGTLTPALTHPWQTVHSICGHLRAMGR